MNLMVKIYPERSWFTPETYLLPGDYLAYQKHHAEDKSAVYIMKVSSSSQGVGIRILTSPSDLQVTNQIRTMAGSIVQKYIPNPLLLDGLKHDLRLYLLIANADPLVAFLNVEGLARFCTERYALPTANSKYSVNSQLTNYSINKASDDYVMTRELLEPNNGTKRTLTSYWKSLTQAGFKVDKIKEEIVSLCQHMLKAIQPRLRYFQRSKLKTSAEGLNAMHIVGVDVLIDSNGRPWLLEANATPSMAVEFCAESQTSKTGPIENRKEKEAEYKKSPISAVDFYVKAR